MTAAAAEPDSNVLRFTSDEKRDTTRDVIPLQLGDSDEVYTAVRPKIATLLALGEVLVGNNVMAQAGALNSLITDIFDEPSAEALRARLADPEEDLDLDSPELTNMLEYLMGAWYERPPTQRSASRRSPARTGKRSTVRRR